MGIFRTVLIAAALISSGCVHAQSEGFAASSHTKDANVHSVHDLYLEVNLNGQPTSLIVHFRELDGRLTVAGKDLGDVGLNVDRLGISQATDVQLDSIPGLHYTYNAAEQTVDLQAPDNIRKPYKFDTRILPKAPHATSSSGLFINYDAFTQTGSDTQLALANDEHYFMPLGVLSNSGVAYLSGAEHHYMRYDTSWSHSNVLTNNTTQIGDTISASLAWTRSIRIGGFQWGSNFALRPDLVTFPVPALYGSAVVPSAVDVYINSVKQYSGNVPSGPFIMNNVPGITGAGQATVITRDALGRTITTSMPLYVDPRMLAAGLSSYSFEAGFVRRAYGLESFSYDPHPVLSGTMRYGLTSTLTLEGHAEATHNLVNAGGGALMRFGQLGVVNGSLSASSGSFAGTQASLGYQLIRRDFSINAQTVRAFGNFGDLASSQGSLVPSATDQVTFSFPFMRHQTFSLSYIGSKYPDSPSSKIGSISCTLNFGHLTSLSLSAYKDFEQHSGSGAFITLSLGFLHKTSISTTVGRENGQSNYNINAIRSPDYAGGWGWGAQAEGMGNTPFRQAQVQYLGNDGEVTAAAQNIGKVTNASLDITGAAVLMDRSVQLSRRIDNGFALVSTDGVAGIPVLHENRLIGVTDGSGHLLIPDLNAYQNNEVSIEPMNLPANVRLAATSMNLTPQAQSGVLAHFGMTRYQAASVILDGPDGKILPPGTQVHHEESGKGTIVGYDGLAFIDGLVHDNHLLIGSGTSRCTTEFTYTPPSDGSLRTIGPLKCRSLTGGRQ
ncbi:fimbria/pilus outer membrane usher protein [Trinickia acidisoli]|uniref:fimbria/pilus outer membrane usher protein n=1 Tax=Trinickia acidisoli TaxID=2767482 RepID=UPI002852F221|nr:fimbria/pilus outer membrane usher protein [Trinickia acidisoli]